MVGSVSSANPEKLEHYAAIGENLDQELLSQSNPLTAQLEHFEATCTEPGCRTNATGLGAELRSYGRDLFPFDDWVRQIGRRFAWADGLRLGGRVGSLKQRTNKAPSDDSERSWLARILELPPWLAQIIAKLPWVKSKSFNLEGETELGKLISEEKSEGPAVPEPTSAPPPFETELRLLIKKQPRREIADLNPTAPLNDCVKFVKGQPGRKVPVGFNGDDFYSGRYKGKTGVLPDGTEYGQVPRVGAIMVESPNNDVGIDYGHASYVYEVVYDENGKVISFIIAEGGMGKGEVNYVEFYWDPEQNRYVSKDGNRSPDMFIL